MSDADGVHRGTGVDLLASEQDLGTRVRRPVRPTQTCGMHTTSVAASAALDARLGESHQVEPPVVPCSRTGNVVKQSATCGTLPHLRWCAAWEFLGYWRGPAFKVGCDP